MESYSRHISSGSAGQFARTWPFNADTRCPEAADRCRMDSRVKVLVLGGRCFGVISCIGRGNLSTRRSELQVLRRPTTEVYHLVCARLPYKEPVLLSTHIHTDDMVKRPSRMQKSTCFSSSDVAVQSRASTLGTRQVVSLKVAKFRTRSLTPERCSDALAVATSTNIPIWLMQMSLVN